MTNRAVNFHARARCDGTGGERPREITIAISNLPTNDNYRTETDCKERHHYDDDDARDQDREEKKEGSKEEKKSETEKETTTKKVRRLKGGGEYA